MSTIGIIGGGPAGYVAAITAAQQGGHVILIEQGPLGGTCLNVGCMPTKTLLESAGRFHAIKHAKNFGIRLNGGEPCIDWPAVLERKNAIVATLVQGIQYLMKKNKITVVKGKASFQSARSVLVETQDGVQEVAADHFIIAAGSEPSALPFAPFDGKWIIDSTQAMSLPEIPESLLIVGGGVIGCEFASIYSRIGTKVVIAEMAGQILPGEDPDIAAVLQQQLEQDGVTIYTSAAVKALEAETKTAVLEQNSTKIEVQADFALVSIGRKPKITGLGLENAGVDYSRSGILVNERMQTSHPSIYACGDVIGGIQLAHVAFHEGKVAARNAAGITTDVNYHAVPRCIYSFPEIAGVGLTEKQAREKYGEIQTGEFPFSANGKAMITGEPTGKVKVIIEPQYQEIVGLSIVGPHATELIGQGALMLHTEMTADIFEHYIAAHPTVSEAIHEALLSASGHAVHA
ncbi:dihydrolipoyl dehydrogenase [Heyndrickxia acidiproducens]|uniref:dihydrolipoyl dehydrogenase n=1 Tax=Heyndrickxia acidiproducens TaxID=1121084 RepID=UPI0003679BC0|nr:dihydrolipoyl dehydrogenase [Heyndrickxia acidiproducens]